MRRLLPSALLLAALLVAPVAADGHEPLTIPNADFESVRELPEGAYACRFEDWLFKSRSGAYEHGPSKGPRGTTVARVWCTDGKAGRADLLGPLLELPPFTEFRVAVTVRQKDATAVVALHPTYRRRQTDVALVGVGPPTERRYEATLRTGAESERYRFTLGIVGDGFVEFDDLEVVQGETVGPAKGTVVILDMNGRPPGWHEPDPFWMEDEIRTCWGYDVQVLDHVGFDASKLEQRKPRCVVIMPLATYDVPPGDEQARARGRRKVAAWLRKTRIPILGICLGHQVLGRASGGRMTKADERGDVDLHRAEEDPIFAGLDPVWPCSESHRYALTETPKGFDLLAVSAGCEIQVIRRRGRLHYGFQGHIERGWTNTTPHGRVVLGNFFRMLER